jgi:hypoxanthine phosphoribosyltransferase
MVSKISGRPEASKKMVTKTDKSHSKDGGGQNEKWWSEILEKIPPDARVFALVALISAAGVIAVITLLPAPQRLYGYLVFACLLIATLIATVFVKRRSVSQDHNQPNLGKKVQELTKRLVEDRFLPDLIIAIHRGGLGIAGMLAQQLGDEEIVPVISLSRLEVPAGFNNPFNRLSFTLQDFGTTNPVKILIVDDICRSGRTLIEATTFVDGSIRSQRLALPGKPRREPDFVIKTAAISFYRSSSRATEPTFFVDRPVESIRDVSGNVEYMEG